MENNLAQLLNNANSWTLKQDALLRACLECFTKNVAGSMDDLDSLKRNLDFESETVRLRLENIHSKIAFLKMTKFIDERILDVVSENHAKSVTPDSKKPLNRAAQREQTTNAIKAAVKEGLKLVQERYDQFDNAMYRPKEYYVDRKLPPIIGSAEFKNALSAGTHEQLRGTVLEQKEPTQVQPAPKIPPPPILKQTSMLPSTQQVKLIETETRGISQLSPAQSDVILTITDITDTKSISSVSESAESAQNQIKSVHTVVTPAAATGVTQQSEVIITRALPEPRKALLEQISKVVSEKSDSQNRSLFSSSSEDEDKSVPSTKHPISTSIQPRQSLSDTKSLSDNLPESSKTPSEKPLTSTSLLDTKKELLFASSSEEEMPKPVLKSFDMNFENKLAAAIKHGPPVMRPNRPGNESINRRPVSTSALPQPSEDLKPKLDEDENANRHSFRASVPPRTGISTNEELGPSSVASRIAQIGNKIPVGMKRPNPVKSDLPNLESQKEEHPGPPLPTTIKERPKGPIRRVPTNLRRSVVLAGSNDQTTTSSTLAPISIKAENIAEQRSDDTGYETSTKLLPQKPSPKSAPQTLPKSQKEEKNDSNEETQSHSETKSPEKKSIRVSMPKQDPMLTKESPAKSAPTTAATSVKATDLPNKQLGRILPLQNILPNRVMRDRLWLKQNSLQNRGRVYSTTQTQSKRDMYCIDQPVYYLDNFQS
ncbi:WASH complex subunit 2 [Ditylenchus destructor]|uniref:WASH complex subunit 2 n=1 Tax=Ditylenchus destructor TaxID=166010 RepID=A0AAD4MZN4_9BILA|nr:WASH complex subunit 2 [Ditylenchus destructor]